MKKIIFVSSIFIIYQLLQIFQLINLLTLNFYLYLLHPLYVIAWVIILTSYKDNIIKPGYFYVLIFIMMILLIINIYINEKQILNINTYQILLLMYIFIDLYITKDFNHLKKELDTKHLAITVRHKNSLKLKYFNYYFYFKAKVCYIGKKYRKTIIYLKIASLINMFNKDMLLKASLHICRFSLCLL
ncbi:hypothetical protein [Halothermothrix orenii]|nr:hypothetical protein [Halothermothrix orenii]